LNAVDVFEPSIEKETATVSRETKLSSSMTMLGHILQDILGNAEMGGLTPPAVLSRRCSYLNLFRSMAHGLGDQHFRSYEEVKKWIDSWITSKDASFFRDDIRQYCQKDEKK